MFSFSGRRGRTQGRTIRRGSAGGRGVITDQIGIIYTPKEREREREKYDPFQHLLDTFLSIWGPL